MQNIPRSRFLMARAQDEFNEARRARAGGLFDDWGKFFTRFDF